MKNNNILFTIIISFVIIKEAFAVKGVDLSTAATVQNFECMKSDGNSFAIMRGYRSYGAVDPNAA